MSAISDYSAEEQATLNKLGYFWREEDKEWWSDKYETNRAIYIDYYQSSPQRPEYCIRCEGRYDSDGYRESDDYTYFNSFKELIDHLT
jgi:hypothetical protein